MVRQVTNAQQRLRAMTWMLAACMAVASGGCGSSTATRKPVERQVAAPVIAPTSDPEPAPQPEPAPPTPEAAFTPAPPVEKARPSVRIRGLTGTLNTDDVHQTMEARQRELDACIMESRRRLRLVSGKIQFSFKIDAEGAVEDVHPIESNIGHFALESCILRVLSETVFPKPDGDASARFEWGLSVEPATKRQPEPIDPATLEKVLDKHASEVREACETKKRERFTVTAYINRRGKIVSAGAMAEPADAAEKLECVLEGIKGLKMPKQKRDGKVTFVLK